MKDKELEKVREYTKSSGPMNVDKNGIPSDEGLWGNEVFNPTDDMQEFFDALYMKKQLEKALEIKREREKRGKINEF